jgi:hypothetical protein
MNNTEKLDDIRRRLRVIETRLTIIQRASIIMFERTAFGSHSPRLPIMDSERKILDGARTLSDDEFWEQITSQYRQS